MEYDLVVFIPRLLYLFSYICQIAILWGDSKTPRE